MVSSITPERVSKDLAPILPRLYAFLDAGCARAQEFFSTYHAPIDAALFSHLVRWSFLQCLRVEAPLLGIEAIEDLGLSGISFRYGSYPIRVWKADDSDLTKLASSDTKKAFLAQQTQWDFETGAIAAPLLNLALLWNVDRDGHLQAVRFGPPHVQDERFTLAWEVDVPLPGTEPQPSRSETSSEVVTDLHFERTPLESPRHERR